MNFGMGILIESLVKSDLNETYTNGSRGSWRSIKNKNIREQRKKIYSNVSIFFLSPIRFFKVKSDFTKLVIEKR